MVLTIPRVSHCFLRPNFTPFLPYPIPQVGDQILKVCGMPVLQSTHREVVTVIQGRARLQLKVGHSLDLIRRRSPLHEAISSS